MQEIYQKEKEITSLNNKILQLATDLENRNSYINDKEKNFLEKEKKFKDEIEELKKKNRNCS